MKLKIGSFNIQRANNHAYLLQTKNKKRETKPISDFIAREGLDVCGITEYDDEMERLKIFCDELSRGGAHVDTYRGECPEDKAENYDLVIYSTFGHEHKPNGAIQIVPSWQTGAITKDSIVVAFGSPYLINANFPTVNTAIAAYSDTEHCMRAAAKCILGKLSFKGKLPVKLQEI